MKYLIYARKSTESDDRQAMSIESQINELKRLASTFGFTVDKIFRESMSAKQSGRPVFDEMLGYITKAKGCVVLAWKVDRLTRNIADGARLVDLLEKGCIKEIRTIDKIILDNPTDKFMLVMDFGVGKKYSDDLSVNVKRGNRAKLDLGGWPGIAPVGYLNDKINKTIVIDPSIAPYIKKAFELYATGGYSIMGLTNYLYQSGMRSRTGQKYHKSRIHLILTNPFYCGLMKREDRLYQGRHEQVVSQQLFQEVQASLNRRLTPRRKTDFFALRGYLKCGGCGCAFTASRKKGHEYYYCTNGRGRCEEHKSYLRSENAESIVATIFDDLQFEPELIEMAYLAKKEKGQHDEKYSETARENAMNGLDFIARKEKKLLDSHLAELIPDGVYEAKMKELANEKEMLKRQLKDLDAKSEQGLNTLEPIKEAFLFPIRAKKDFPNGSPIQKNKILEKLLWNLEIKEKALARVSYKMPYEVIKKAPKNGDFSEMLGRKGSNLRMVGPEPTALPLGYSPMS